MLLPLFLVSGQHPRVGKRRMKMRDYMEDCYRGYGSDGEGENEQKVYR